MPTTFVLGYDASDTGKKALAQVAEIAGHLDDGEVFVVSAYEFTIGYVPMGMTDSPLMISAEYDQHVDLVRSACDRQVAEAVAVLEGAGVRASGEAREGRPVDVLLDAAREKQAAAIVVGSHGEGAVSAAFLGSTALKLLHHSEIPVLVVPKHDKE
ncbi:MAG TPA: universal stress protein [Thermoleophilia bacterium]|nr:universal stress protein [Thermoleophilia bacterium]